MSQFETEQTNGTWCEGGIAIRSNVAGMRSRKGEKTTRDLDVHVAVLHLLEVLVFVDVELVVVVDFEPLRLVDGLDAVFGLSSKC